MREKLFIGLPCYNEEKDINTLLDRILKVKQKVQEKFNIDVEIFCVNDGSKDNTEKTIIDREKDGVKLINHDVNKVLGEAMRTILMHFINQGNENDYLVVMDSDNTHNPQYIIDMIEKQKQEKEHIIIASRYQKGATITGLKKHRILLSDFAKIWYNIMLKIPNVKDYTCGYRLYTHEIATKTYKKYRENVITQSSFACMMEILYKMYLSGAIIGEIPFKLEYNLKEGTSKMKIIKTSINSIITTVKIKKQGAKSK